MGKSGSIFFPFILSLPNECSVFATYLHSIETRARLRYSAAFWQNAVGNIFDMVTMPMLWHRILMMMMMTIAGDSGSNANGRGYLY